MKYPLSVLCLLVVVALPPSAAGEPLAGAVAALERGDTSAAVALLGAQADNPEAQLYLAKIYLVSDLDEAEEWADKAAVGLPDNAEAQFVRANIMCMQAQSASVFSAVGYARKCRQGYEQAVALAPANVEFLNGLMQYYLNAPAIAGGDMERARELRDQIGELDHMAGLRARFDYHWSREEHEQVLAVLEQATREYGDLPDFYYYGGLYFQRREDFPAAFEQFQQAYVKEAVTEDSQVAKYGALYQIGRTAVLSEERVDAGIAALQEYGASAPVLAGLPEQDWASFRLAGLYELADREPEARRIYTALAEADNAELRDQARKRLKKL